MQADFNYTGFGRMSGGHAPSSYERQRNSSQMQSTMNVAEAVTMNDPYVRRYVESAVRSIAKDPSNQNEMRRLVFNDPRGQAFKDVAMGLRRKGYLGHGDPVESVHQLMKAVGGAGVNLTTFDQAGRASTFTQSATGSGMLMEQAVSASRKQLMYAAYGAGNPDPGKFHGLDMEKQAALAGKIIEARGGIKGTYQDSDTGMDIKAKIFSRKQYEQDRDIVSFLTDNEIDDSNIDTFIKAQEKLGNKKYADVLKTINTNKGFMTLEPSDLAKVAEVQDNLGGALAMLGDVYDELSGEDLVKELERIHGLGSLSLKRSSASVKNVTAQLLGTADLNGLDRREFLDRYVGSAAIDENTAMILGAMGLQSKSADSVRDFSAFYTSQTAVEAGHAAALQAETAGKINKAGGSVVARNLDQMVSDQNEVTGKFMGQNSGYVMALGLQSQGQIGAGDQDQLNNLLRQFEESTPETRAAVENSLKAFVGSRFGHNGSFDSAQDALGESALAALGRDNLGRDRLFRARDTAGRQDLTSSGLAYALKTHGDVSDPMLETLLTQGLGRHAVAGFLEVGQGESTTPETRMTDVREYLAKSALSAEDQERFIQAFINEDLGMLKNEEGFLQVVQAMNNQHGEDLSLTGLDRKAQLKLNNTDGSVRHLMSRGEGGLLKTVVRSLMTGETKGFSTLPQKIMALQAAAESAPELVGDLAIRGSMFDFQDEFTPADMTKLRGIVGDDFKLYDSSEFSSDQEFQAKVNRSASRRAEMMEHLMGSEGITAGGKANEFAVADIKSVEDFDALNLDTLLMQQAARDEFLGGEGRNMVVRDWEGKYSGSLTDKTWNLGKALVSFGVGGPSLGTMAIGKWQREGFNGKKYAEADGSLLHNMASVSRGLAMDDLAFKSLVEGDAASGGKLLENLKAQQKTLQLKAVNDMTHFVAEDSEGNRTTVDVGESLQKINSLIARFAESELNPDQTPQTMIIQQMDVLNMTPPPK